MGFGEVIMFWFEEGIMSGNMWWIGKWRRMYYCLCDVMKSDSSGGIGVLRVG
ncbi:hypothetical protein [Staphylococcus epidermidis]|uniref:hypothetical protein n=1 Tax=Staphylococcus epidermidis TaxID=1282 RepID=UPI001642643C|nr:hypothetical protein [Staphylococcus epidermidis]